jgi:hypothetical protein
MENMVEIGSGQVLLRRGEFRNFTSVNGTKESSCGVEN